MISDLMDKKPEQLSFHEVIECIDSYYQFTPSEFCNGDLINKPGQNNGSCKVFAFALIHKFDVNRTLNCFGDFYRVDVLKHLEGTDHQNIRNFIKTGWDGIQFKTQPLIPK